MVGMHTTGFDRLVRALDDYAGARSVEVVIQAGSGAYRTRHARCYPYKDRLAEDIGRADLVVSHGSVGFLEAIRMGKRLVVAPRLARYGEAIDDHQVAFSRSCARRFGFPVVLDMGELPAVLDSASASPPPPAVPAGGPTGLHRELAAYLSSLA